MPTQTTGARLVFRLYVAGDAPNSVLARANLKRLQNAMVHGSRLDVEVVDVLERPQRALEDGIIVTPTLIRLAPQPILRIAGNLSDASLVISVLGLEVKPE